jgi:hypothetical protein
MHDAVARHYGAIAYLDPSGQQCSPGDYRTAADAAVVSDMRILHEEVSITYDSKLAVFAATMDRNALAKHVAVADDHSPAPARICKILRLVADNYIGMQDVPGSQFGVTEDRNMAHKSAARAQPNPPFEQAEGSNVDAGRQLDLRADH